MKHFKLEHLNFMAFCCVLGLVTKKLINPAANVITEALHIPGGISTGFSLMFLVIAAEFVNGAADGAQKESRNHCGALMGAVQGLLALCLGRVGSMGILAPIGYFMPGAAIDLVYESKLGRTFTRKLSRMERMTLANALAAVMASVTANLIVFRLWGPALCLYLCVSAFSGTVYGMLGASVAGRLEKTMFWKTGK